jgi:hypothetical protein
MTRFKFRAVSSISLASCYGSFSTWCRTMFEQIANAYPLRNMNHSNQLIRTNPSPGAFRFHTSGFVWVKRFFTLLAYAV